MSDLVSGLLAKLDELEQRGPYPDEVLRLCQAHRDIIEMYVQAKAQPVAESVPHSKGRGLDHASAMGRLTTLGLVLQVLARGLGVEEQSSE